MKSEVFNYNGSPVTFQLGEATMVNATEMAKPFGKQAKDWLKTAQTKEFITALSEVKKILSDDLVVVSKGNFANGNPQGTWFHEDVAIEFARWLSPKFAIWCNDRIKELARYGVTATPAAVDAMLADPDTKIRTLQMLKMERERADSAERTADNLLDALERKSIENTRLLNANTANKRQLAAQAPKVEYADKVLSSVSTYTATQLAKELGFRSGRELNKLLHGLGVQYKYRNAGQWLLYAKYAEKGYTATRTHEYTKTDGVVFTSLTTVWTETGRMFVHGIIKKWRGK